MPVRSRTARRRHVSCAVVAALAAIPVLAACAGGSDAVDPTANGQFKYIGAQAAGKVIAVDKRKTAGDVTGPMLTGNSTFSLAAEKNKVVVLNFWASWCSPCQTETPAFDKLYRTVKATGVQFVGLDVKDPNRGSAQSFVRQNDISYPIVYDQPARTALQLGNVPMVGLPDTVVIDKQGRVAAVYVGAVANGDLAPVLKSLAAET